MKTKLLKHIRKNCLYKFIKSSPVTIDTHIISKDGGWEFTFNEYTNIRFESSGIDIPFLVFLERYRHYNFMFGNPILGSMIRNKQYKMDNFERLKRFNSK